MGVVCVGKVHKIRIALFQLSSMYMYTHLHTRTHAHEHNKHTHTCTHTNTHTRMHTHTHTCTHTCTYTRTHAHEQHVRTHIHAHTRAHIHACMHTHTHAHAHTHTHTCTHMLPELLRCFAESKLLSMVQMLFSCLHTLSEEAWGGGDDVCSVDQTLHCEEGSGEEQNHVSMEGDEGDSP